MVETPGDQGGQQTQGGVQATLFTQEQVNGIAAQEKRAALRGFFKDLGFDDVPDAETLKGTITDAGEYKKIKDGEKGDVERLQGQLTAEQAKTATIPELQATINRQKIAGDEGLPTRFWRYVEGKTDDEIKESIKGIKTELGLDGDNGGGTQQQQQVTGTGARPPAPNPQQGATNGGGATGGKSLAAGREAYEKKHGKRTKE